MNCVKTKTTNSLTVESTKNRLFAKQHIMKTAGTCKKWEPNNKLIKAVEDGTIKRRYTERLRKIQEDGRMTLHEGVDDDIEESFM